MPRFAGNTSTAATTEQPVAAPANVNTVFVVNRQQLARIYGATLADATITALKNRLNTFKNAGYPGVDPAGRCRRRPSVTPYDGPTGWNACPSDPTAANAVVAAVDARVRAFKAAKPTVQYVVLVGSDDVIPFARLDDRTTLSNEDAFAGSFDPSSPIGGALASSKMLSDDPYGTLAPIPFFDRQLYVPELGVSRLVETPAQIQAQVNAFTNGQIAGGTALTTGYDFLSDGAQRVSTSLGRVATANATLINADVERSANLTAALTTNGGQPPSLVSINAHADDSRFQAANGTLFTTDTSSRTRSPSPAGSSSRWAATPGSTSRTRSCRRHGAPTGPRRSRSRGASVYLANTGFGYGDSDIVAYSEDLNARFAANLADGMTAGAAFADAKAGFQGDLGLVGVYDEKAMAELTLYGLPMVSITGAHPAAAASAGFTVLCRRRREGRRGRFERGAARHDGQAIRPSGSTTRSSRSSTRPCIDSTRRTNSTDGRGDYFHGRDGADRHAPAADRAEGDADDRDAERARRPDHGADVAGRRTPFDPLFARPTVDSTRIEPEIGYDDVAFPAKLQTVTSVKGFAAAPEAEADPRPGPVLQHQPGRRRARVASSGCSRASTVASSSRPTRTTWRRRSTAIDALKTGGTVTFSTDIASSDPVKRVLVLFLGASSGAWTPGRAPTRGREPVDGIGPDDGVLRAVLRPGRRLARERRRLDEQGLLLRGRPGGRTDRLDHDRPDAARRRTASTRGRSPSTRSRPST